MRKRGEITVFLCLALVSILSLLMGLLESARTAGARLYLTMAADSAAASVMSQYNRELWERYRLLFLEAESEKAIADSFGTFLDYYLEQENLYPMKREETEIAGIVRMEENGGEALEKEILSYIGYRLPEAAADAAGIAREAAQAAKAADFRELLRVCREAGAETKRLEKKRAEAMDVLEDITKLRDGVIRAAERENAGAFRSRAQKLKRKINRFSGCVDGYGKELERLSAHRASVSGDNVFASRPESEAKEPMDRELSAYEQTEKAAAETLSEFRETERRLLAGKADLESALELLEEAENAGDDEADETDPDWDSILALAQGIEAPDIGRREKPDREKMSALDRLEKLLDADLLKTVLPPGTAVSERKVSLQGIPSQRRENGGPPVEPAGQFLIGEYILLSFDSFLEKAQRGQQELLYEQEYILCGRSCDRDNLRETAERLLAIRGAANLLYLLGSPEKRAEAEALAAAVSAGNVPVKFVLTFFVLTLWAFGESVADLRSLFAGGSVPLWKTETTWRTGMESLLSLAFLDFGRDPAGNGETQAEGGFGYGSYFRILLFLENRNVRNFRMMDLIQWNLRKTQADFAVSDCIYEAEMRARVRQRHLFLLKSGYLNTAAATIGY